MQHSLLFKWKGNARSCKWPHRGHRSWLCGRSAPSLQRSGQQRVSLSSLQRWWCSFHKRSQNSSFVRWQKKHMSPGRTAKPRRSTCGWRSRAGLEMMVSTISMVLLIVAMWTNKNTTQFFELLDSVIVLVEWIQLQSSCYVWFPRNVSIKKGPCKTAIMIKQKKFFGLESNIILINNLVHLCHFILSVIVMTENKN